MIPAQFDIVFGLIEVDITKRITTFRMSIPPRQRLFVTLRYLATGDSFQTIATSFSMGKSTVRSIVDQVNNALWRRMSPIYMKVATCEAYREWILKTHFQTPRKEE